MATDQTVAQIENAKQDFRARLTNKLIEQLETGTAPFQKPWDARLDLMPQNPITGKPYRGINNLALTLEGRADPRWMTYKQAAAAGYQVNKGEKGSQIEYWKHSEQQPKLDTAGSPVIGSDGKPETINVTLSRPRVFTAVVFNAEQMTGVPELAKVERTYDWAPEERAEQILKASGAKITHEQANRAFYRSSTDSIHLPGKDQFRNSAAYYGTALHELGHWTGHHSRLDRDLTGAFGSVSYAKEELRAELSSYFLADRLGIPHDPGHHASYVASWIEVLKQDKNEIFKAAAAAEKITEFVLHLGNEVDLTKQVQSPQSQIAIEDTVLVVPFSQKELAKAAGARWNPDTQFWYAPKNASLEPLKTWLPNYKEVEQSISAATRNASLDPHDEFGAAIRAAGLVLEGQPIMDGKFHRVPIEGKGASNRDGAYVGHLDGKPAGFIQNHATGLKENWAIGGDPLSAEQKEVLHAQMQVAKQLRDVELAEQHEAVALKSAHKWDSAKAIGLESDHPYLQRKNTDLAYDVRVDSAGNLLVPMRDIDGKVWSLQSISPEGEKRFEAGGLKRGTMHFLTWSDYDVPTSRENPIERVKPSEPLIVAEGFATASTIARQGGVQAVVAFDAGNLDPVVASLKERFPTTPIFIAADNDRNKTKNVGVETAALVADKYGVGVIVPQFGDEKIGSDFNDLGIGVKVTGSSLQKLLVRDQIEKGIAVAEEQSRQAALSLGKSVLGEKAATLNADAQIKLGTDEFCGKVVGLTRFHAVQASSSKELVVHAIKSLDRLPIVGRDLSIKYKKNPLGQEVGVVKPACKALAVDRQR